MSQSEAKLFDTSHLIDEVRKRPGLYDKNVDMDRDEKLTLWKEIGTEVYSDWGCITKAEAYDRVLELQRKWRSVRDALCRELRYRRQGKTANRKQYKYFKQLNFITNEEDLDDGDQDDGTLDMHSVDIEGTTESDPLQTKKRKIIKKKIQAKRKKSPEASPKFTMPLFHVDSTSEEDKDSDRLFLLSFAPELGKLPTHIKMWARAQIANVMQQAVNCNFNNSFPEGSFDDVDHLDVKRQRLSSHENIL